MTEPQFFQLLHADPQALVAEASSGLSQPQAHLSPKFLYDPLGSRLFDAITELDEYYPTRTEAGILAAQRDNIAQAVHARLGPHPTLIDLGAGNCAKAAGLFGSLKPAHYVALDFSVDFLFGAMRLLQLQHPQVQMTGVGLDFSSSLDLPQGLISGPALLFYPGSSIGNFGPEQALRLLRQVCKTAAGGSLLIGVDLHKSAAVLEAAYDDALGVTSAFNLNMLRHLNQLIGSNFDLRQWRHVALFNAEHSRIEMHLEARQALTVQWPGHERRFRAGERIHTENSYKWQRGDFEALVRDAGFGRLTSMTDSGQNFLVCLAHSA